MTQMKEYCVKVIGYCWIQSYCFEILTRDNPSVASVVTLMQFVFVVVSSLVMENQRTTLARFKLYLGFALLLALITKSNNIAVSSGVSMPFVLLFRSCTVAASVVVGCLGFKRRYSMLQMIAAFTLTVGMCMCTLFDHRLPYHCALYANTVCDNPSGFQALHADTGKWTHGISFMVFALVASAAMGHAQDWMHKNYPVEGGTKPHQEFMFYNHLLALPWMIWTNSDLLYDVFFSWDLSEPYTIVALGISIPWRFCVLVLCILSGYGCTQNAYSLSAETSTLTLNIVLTVRKALSILFSIWYYDHKFTMGQWAGAFVVLLGTLLYSISGTKPIDRRLKQA